MTMRRFLFFVLASLLSGPLHAEVPSLLAAAVQKVADNYNHWAYTQTVVEQNEKGRIMSETAVRFDPSRPYAEQFTPLAIDGRPPSAAQMRKYRRQGEKRGEKIEQADRDGISPPRQTLGELMDLDRASLLAEDREAATFEVPLKQESNHRLPPEKFRVTARVNKASGAFERIDVTLRSPMRAELIVKIKSGVGRLEFSSVDPKHAPALTAISGSGAGSILFVPVGRSYELKRGDFQRVKPFGDRFQVKYGPLKSLDF